MKKITVFNILFLIFCFSAAQAALRSSANYQIKADVSDQVGTKSASVSYSIIPGAGGQPGVIGKSTSPNYKTGQGYIYGLQDDYTPPTIPGSLTAEARPTSAPTYVYLSWLASTDESGMAGYNLYRSNTPGSGYIKIMSLIQAMTTNDASVSLGTDYYYVATAQDIYNNESAYSNQASAPLLSLTREALVVAPIIGGYKGSAQDAVPGSTIKYNIYQTNKGFAVATSIEVVDSIPLKSQFKIGSATGEAITSVKYSNDNGATFNYIPSGTNVDPSVTNIKWLCSDMVSGITRKVEFAVVIR